MIKILYSHIHRYNQTLFLTRIKYIELLFLIKNKHFYDIIIIDIV